MNKKKIQTMLSIIMMVAMVFAMSACGGNEMTSDAGNASDGAVSTDGTASSGDPITSTEASEAAGMYIPPALEEDVTYYADIEIADYGTITIQLDQKSAPITCANFVELAESGFYDGLTFHRIIIDFMMQGGDPEGNGMGGSENEIYGEFAANGIENNISHTRGTISMARANAPNSASSQFFICHADSTFLDGNYAAFGHVIEGIEVVDAVCEAAQPTDGNGTIPDDDQPVMTSVKIRTE